MLAHSEMNVVFVHREKITYGKFLLDGRDVLRCLL